MSRILALLPTTSYRPTALNAAARAVGVDLVIGSNRRQSLEHLTEGRTLTLDFGALEEASRTVADFAAAYPLDGIIGVDDETTLVAAEIATRMGLRSHSPESVRVASNKALSRAALSAAGLPSPAFEVFDLRQDPQGIATTVRFPCVLKPTFLSGSRGVMRADDPDDFVVKYHRLARILSDPEVVSRGGAEAERVLVEDYIPGDEVAVEGIVEQGELHVLAIFDKPDPLTGPFFQETIYVTPSRHDASKRASIEESTRRAVRALGLGSGPVHAELRLGPGGPVVLEVAPRAIGGRCGKVLELVSGRGVEELVLRHVLGETITVEARSAAGVMMIPIARAGVLEALHGTGAARDVPGITGLELVSALGDSIEPPPEGHRYLGFLFARGESPEQVERALRSAHGLLELQIA